MEQSPLHLPVKHNDQDQFFEAWNSKKINAVKKKSRNISFTSAITSLISCSALLICSDVPVNSTSLVRELGSASESLVIWILAPDWACSCFIVSPSFPIITPTCKMELQDTSLVLQETNFMGIIPWKVWRAARKLEVPSHLEYLFSCLCLNHKIGLFVQWKLN